MRFSFNQESVGRVINTSKSFEYHTPFHAVIASAIWYETKDYYGMRINFTVKDSTKLESVNVVYAFKEDEGHQESPQATILHNLVPILNLKDNTGHMGMQSVTGRVTNTVYDEGLKRYVAQEVEAEHEPNMTGKEIGLILYQHYYTAQDSTNIKSVPRIFEVFDLITKQTGEDIANDLNGTDAKLMNLCIDAENYSKNQLAKLKLQVAQQQDGSADVQTQTTTTATTAQQYNQQQNQSSQQYATQETIGLSLQNIDDYETHIDSDKIKPKQAEYQMSHVYNNSPQHQTSQSQVQQDSVANPTRKVAQSVSLEQEFDSTSDGW